MVNLKSKKTILVLCTVLFVATFATVMAAGTTINFATSDPVKFNPKPVDPVTDYEGSKVAVSASEIDYGEYVKLTAVITPKLKDVTVMFYDQDDAVVGSAVTNDQGVATLKVKNTNVSDEVVTFNFYGRAVIQTINPES